MDDDAAEADGSLIDGTCGEAETMAAMSAMRGGMRHPGSLSEPGAVTA